METFLRLLKWGIWTVGISFVPIAWCMLLLKNHNMFDRWSTPWARGELLLISVMIVATSLGDLLTATAKKIPMRPYLAGAAVIFLLLAGGWYVDVLASVSAWQWYDDNLVRHRSPVVFGLSLLIAAACIMLSKEAQKR